MIGQQGEHSTTIDTDRLVTLHYDTDQPIDVDALQGVLAREKVEVWSDATIGGEEPFDRIWLRLTVADDRTVRIQADQQAVTSGLCAPAIPVRSPALVDGGSLAYLTIRRSDDQPGRWQLGAAGHGPDAEQLTARIVDEVAAWDRDRTADPHLVAYPTSTTPPAEPQGKVIVKPETRLYLT
ncbi:hypothetical protein [Salinispora arenicola]|uniref:hypothetical protein n=1 Tax=Salinispora arenicola TaxID=168697 RepID=UPI00036ECDA7|nr:hypothetical protein [Salinispora arenicola]